MRYVKLALLWLAGLAIPVVLAWLTAMVGWEAVPKIMFSFIGGYFILWMMGCIMGLFLNTSLDEIGGWTFGINLVALSIGGQGLYLAIGTSAGILAGWYMLRQSKRIWQRKPA